MYLTSLDSLNLILDRSVYYYVLVTLYALDITRHHVPDTQVDVLKTLMYLSIYIYPGLNLPHSVILSHQSCKGRGEGGLLLLDD